MIDHDQHTTDRVTDGPLLDLHDELVAAFERHHGTPVASLAARRRPTRRLAYAVGGVAATIALVVGVLLINVPGNESEVAADVTVRQEGNSVTVSIEHNIDVSQIEAAMRDTGVEVTVVPTPTGPSRVNRFVGIVGPPSARLTGGDGTASNSATFVKGSEVQILLGVAADGRPYDVPTDAWLRNEPLAGEPLTGTTFAESGAELERRATAAGATLDLRSDANGQPTTPQPTDVIVSAQATSATSVLVMLHRG